MPVPTAIVDVLNSLLEAEQGSLFRFMMEGTPYLGRASNDVRKTVNYIAASDYRRAGELWQIIDELGGEPRAAGVQPEEQFLAYLSVKFILPKLVEAKELLMQRYRNAIAAVGPAPGPATDLLKRHLSEHAGEMEILLQAAEAVAKG